MYPLFSPHIQSYQLLLLLGYQKGELLSVGSVTLLIHEDGMMKDEDIKDVYVGNFNDLGNERFIHLFNYWGKKYPNVAIGLVVLDEFHNFETEWKYRSGSFKTIHKLDFTMVHKLMAITGTAGRDGISKSFNGMNINLTTYMGESNDATFIYDMVENIPLKHVVKFNEHLTNDARCFEKAELLVKLFMEAYSLLKVIVVCGTVEDAKKLAVSCPGSILISGDMEAKEKTAAVNNFINDRTKKVLIGTCLVGEGIDILTVDLVIMLRYNYTNCKLYPDCW